MTRLNYTTIFNMKLIITERQEDLLFSLLTEGKNKPTNPELWSRAKAAAKSKYKVYPSAYANGFASKWYKEHGGGWRTVKKKSSNESIETNEASSPAQQAAIAINMKKKGIKPKNENVNEDLRNWFKEKWVDVSKKVDGKHPPCGRKYADGKSELNRTFDREGVVIRNLDKKISFKAISNKFLLNEK